MGWVYPLAADLICSEEYITQTDRPDRRSLSGKWDLVRRTWARMKCAESAHRARIACAQPDECRPVERVKGESALVCSWAQNHFLNKMVTNAMLLPRKLIKSVAKYVLRILFRNKDVAICLLGNEKPSLKEHVFKTHIQTTTPRDKAT